MQDLSNPSKKTIIEAKNISIDIVKIVAYIVLFDVLFLPYFPYFIMPMSLPLVVLMLIGYGRITYNFYLKLISVIAIAIIVSVLASIAIGRTADVVVANTKRAFQLLTTFAYFFYFQETLKRRNLKKIKNILLLFIIYQFLLAILFFMDPQYLVDLKNIVYTSSSYAADNVLMHLRYSYMFVDPNTAAYFFLLVVYYVYSKYTISIASNIFIIIATLILLFSFQSNGAILVTIIGAVFYIFLNYNFTKGETRQKVAKTLLLILIIGVSITIAFPELRSDIVVVIDRYANRYANTVSSGNPRSGIYIRAISNLFPFMLFGQGYTLLVDGEFFKPHSDHLRFIYSYGFIAYFSTIVFLFKNIFRKKYLFVIPAFTAFTVNTLIDEQKLFALFLIFLACAGNDEKVFHED